MYQNKTKNKFLSFIRRNFETKVCFERIYKFLRSLFSHDNSITSAKAFENMEEGEETKTTPCQEHLNNSTTNCTVVSSNSNNCSAGKTNNIRNNDHGKNDGQKKPDFICGVIEGFYGRVRVNVIAAKRGEQKRRVVGLSEGFEIFNFFYFSNVLNKNSRAIRKKLKESHCNN